MTSESKGALSSSGDDWNEGSNGTPPKDLLPRGDRGDGSDKKVPKTDQKETLVWGLCQIDQFRAGFQNRGLLTSWIAEVLQEAQNELVELLVRQCSLSPKEG